MKVIFVTDTLHPGGSERVMSIIANSLASRGYEVGIICCRGTESFYPLQDVNVYYIDRDNPNLSFIKKSRCLRKYICQQKPDVVIAFMTAVYCFTLASLIGTGQKVITSERIDPKKSVWWRKLVRSIFLPLTDFHVVQTEEIKKYFSRSIQNRCSIIVNPVVETVFEKKDIPKTKRFINVARLSGQKDQKMLIDAFEIVHSQYPDYTLSIFGEGPLENELKQYIRNKGLDNCAFIEGTSTEIVDEMRKSFAFCLSSLYEGMSNAMLEAICVGLPIITTNVSGVSEIIEVDSNGVVVPVHDTNKFAQAMCKLIENPQLVEAMSKNNIAKGSEMFSCDAVTNKWESVIKMVIN